MVFILFFPLVLCPELHYGVGKPLKTDIQVEIVDYNSLCLCHWESLPSVGNRNSNRKRWKLTDCIYIILLLGFAIALFIKHCCVLRVIQSGGRFIFCGKFVVMLETAKSLIEEFHVIHIKGTYNK